MRTPLEIRYSLESLLYMKHCYRREIFRSYLFIFISCTLVFFLNVCMSV